MTPQRDPSKPVEPPPFAPIGKASPGRTELWRAKEAALVDGLLKVSNGNAARALAQRYWPFLWKGEKPKGFEADQCEAQANAPREAAERWLRTHGRQLQWRLELAGDWRLDSTEGRNLRSAVRNKITAWGENHRKASSWLRKLAEQPENATRRKRAAKILREIHSEDDLALIEQSLSNPAGTWTEYADVADAVGGWLQEHDANGGANLAAREVAKLVAIFVDEARIAALGIGDAVTAAHLRVRCARSNDGKEPANEYSHALADALDAVGLPRESWRRAAEAVSTDYPYTDLQSDETAAGN